MNEIHIIDASTLKLFLKVVHDGTGEEIIGETLLNLKQVEPNSLLKRRWFTFQSVQTPRFDLAQLYMLFNYETCMCSIEIMA